MKHISKDTSRRFSVTPELHQYNLSLTGKRVFTCGADCLSVTFVSCPGLSGSLLPPGGRQVETPAGVTGACWVLAPHHTPAASNLDTKLVKQLTAGSGHVTPIKPVCIILIISNPSVLFWASQLIKGSVAVSRAEGQTDFWDTKPFQIMFHRSLHP